MSVRTYTAATLFLCILFVATTALRADTPPMARKFDEFVYGKQFSEWELKARLADFHYGALEQAPEAKAYLIFYRGKRRSSRYDNLWAKAWLIENRNIPASRIVTIEGGYRAHPAMELWVVPVGAKAPKARPSLNPK